MTVRSLGFWFLVVAGLVLCAPVVPPAVAAHYVRQRRRGVPTSRLGFMTRSGRAVLLAVGFLGAELVAVEFFASNYFGAVDEHAAPILGVFLVVLLGAIVAADVVAKEVVAAVRSAAGTRGN